MAERKALSLYNMYITSGSAKRALAPTGNRVVAGNFAERGNRRAQKAERKKKPSGQPRSTKTKPCGKPPSNDGRAGNRRTVHPPDTKKKKGHLCEKSPCHLRKTSRAVITRRATERDGTPPCACILLPPAL